MFGSLVLVFPTAHSGGSLVLRQDGEEWTFDSAAILAGCSRPSIAYIAFYSDVEHEVLPVTSGYRITVTYNLYFDIAPTTPPSQGTEGPFSILPQESEFQTALKTLLADKRFLPEGGQLGFGLRHEYPLHVPDSFWGNRAKANDNPLRMLVNYMKGSDAIVLNACKALGFKISLRIVYATRAGLIMCRNVVYFNGADIGEYDADWILCRYFGGAYLKTGDKKRRRSYPEYEDIVEGWDEIENGAVRKKLDKYGPRPRVQVHWVTPLTKLNEIKETYVAYGNEMTVEHAYGHLCLIANVPPLQYRNDSADTSSH